MCTNGIITREVYNRYIAVFIGAIKFCTSNWSNHNEYYMDAFFSPSVTNFMSSFTAVSSLLSLLLLSHCGMEWKLSLCADGYAVISFLCKS